MRLQILNRNSLNLFHENENNIEALANAIVVAFLNKVNKVLKRGILQGYSIAEDCLGRTLRGRVRWNVQIQKHFGEMPPVEVEYEEFTEDIEENRLIKAASFVLRKVKHLKSSHKTALKALESKLDGVKLVDYDSQHLPEIHFTNLNEYYRPAVDLAKFVLRNFSWTLQHGSFESATFLLYMPRVFEDFVVIALRESQTLSSFGANMNNFPQNKPLRFDTKGSITIKPDFSFWESGECRFVGDCKYKRLKKKKPGEILDENFEDDVNALTPDLYQVLGYTTATKLTTGLLIYAEDCPSSTPEKPIIYQDIQPNNTETLLKRRALNLNVLPAQILLQIEAIAIEIVNTIKQVQIQRKRINSPLSNVEPPSKKPKTSDLPQQKNREEEISNPDKSTLSPFPIEDGGFESKISNFQKIEQPNTYRSMCFEDHEEEKDEESENEKRNQKEMIDYLKRKLKNEISIAKLKDLYPFPDKVYRVKEIAETLGIDFKKYNEAILKIYSKLI